jgi:hypothetical protein
MDLSRLRGGQLIAAVGGVVLLVALLFLDWYSIEATVSIGFIQGEAGLELGAWDQQGFLGTIANLIILAAGVVAVGLAVLTATARTVALPVAASALTAAGGISAVVMVVLRMLFQPGDADFVGLEFGIYLALIGAIAVAYGGWESMKEEGATFEAAREQLQGRLGDRGDSPERPAAPPPTGADAPAATPPSGEESSPAGPSPDEPPPPRETPPPGT